MKLFLLVCSLLLVLGVACAPASRKTPSPQESDPSSQGANSNTGAQAVSNNNGAQNVSASTGDAVKGKTLFGSSCSTCHGPEAKGLPNLGKDLTTSAFVHSQSDAQLMDFIKKGRPSSDPANTTGIDMPPKGGNPAITDANLNDIISFLRSVAQ